MIKDGWHVSKKSVFLFVAFCLWIVPTYLYNVSVFMLISNLFGYAAILLCIIDISKKPQECSVIFWLLVLSIIAQGISTARANPELLSTYIRQNAKTITFYYFLDKFTKSDRATKNINVLLHYLEVMIFINLVTIIIFPNGMYSSGVYTSNYWMGYDNTHIRWQIPALAISFIYSFATKQKITIRTWILTAAVFLSTLIIGSGTATIAVIVFSIGMVYILSGKHKGTEKGIKIFTPLTALLVGVIGTVLVVGGTIAGSQIEIVERIASSLGKDAETLTGRSYIWIGTLAAIQKNMLWGLGYETSDMTSMRLVNTTGYGTSPHNLCLEVLYNGGIVLAVIIVLIYLVIHFKLKRYKNIPLISVCGLWLLIISIMGITEPQYSSQLRLAWIIIGNIPCICEENELLRLSER